MLACAFFCAHQNASLTCIALLPPPPQITGEIDVAAAKSPPQKLQLLSNCTQRYRYVKVEVAAGGVNAQVVGLELNGVAESLELLRVADVPRLDADADALPAVTDIFPADLELVSSVEAALDAHKDILKDERLMKSIQDSSAETEKDFAMIPDHARQMLALYMSESSPRHHAFFSQLNAALADPDREKLQPFRDGLWLMLHGIKLLRPEPEQILYRGVAAALDELGTGYREGEVVRWAGLSTVATNLADVRDFVGHGAPRTIFHVHLTSPEARDLTPFARPSATDLSLARPRTVVLPPNMRFRVEEVCRFGGGLSVVRCLQLQTTQPIMDLAFVDPFEKAVAELKPEFQAATEAELVYALSKARDGDVVCMRPGVCVLQQPLVITVGVTIRSAGPAGLIGGGVVLQGPCHPVVHWQAESGGGLYELEVSQLGANSVLPRQAALLVEKGKPMLTKCTFRADSSAEAAAIIRVEGPFANMHMKECSISSGPGAGIMFSKGAKGTVQHCEISKNSRANVVIEDKDTNPTLEDNDIHSGLMSGVFVKSKGQGIVQRNKIRGNNFANVEVNDSSPEILDNEIFEGLQSGVYCHDNGEAVVRGNRVYANKRANVSISKHANPVIEDNEIRDGAQSGVFVYGEGKGIIRGNKIHKNTFANVEVNGSEPLIENNDVYNGQQSGVYVHGGARVVVRGNKIHENARANISISKKGDPLIEGNDVWGGSQSGIFIYGDGKGRIIANRIFKNTYANVEIKGEYSEPTLELNEIYQGRSCGVLLHEDAGGALRKNRIYENAKEGIRQKEPKKAAVEENVTDGNNVGGG